MMMPLGVRAHDFGTMPAVDLARRIRAADLECVQLAPAKALPGVAALPGVLDSKMGESVRAAFDGAGVQIAVLGCYVNIVHPDMGERARLMARFKEHLRYAGSFGCGIVATETASLNADWSWHPENKSERAFQEALSSVAELVEEAEKWGVTVGIEGVATHVMSSPRHLRRMLDALQSRCLRILFDPVNLLTIENAGEHRRLIDESFDLFGDRICALHVKDYVIDGGKIRSVSAGQGMLDLDYLFRCVAKRLSNIPVILEDTEPGTIGASIARVRRAVSMA